MVVLFKLSVIGHEVSNDMIEGGNSNAESGIVIENLRKVFKVLNLSLLKVFTSTGSNRR